MNIIPIIPIHQFPMEQLSTLLKKLLNKNITELYILDELGIKKNEPCVDAYQALASRYDLWVDAGPRNIDDIVDDLFTGANRIVIRPQMWVEQDIKEIHHLTENEIYLHMHTHELQNFDHSKYQKPYGIIYEVSSTNPLSLTDKNRIKTMYQMQPFYCYNPNIKDKEFFENLDIPGIMIPFDTRDTWIS